MFVVVSCSATGCGNNIETHIDRGGYSYEIVAGDPAGVRVYTLKNGLTVYLARNADEPRIRSMIAVRAGSASDPPGSTGLAHYLEHLLFNGTDKIGALDWSEEQPLLARIEELYERHRAEPDDKKKREIYRQIDSLSVAASRYASPGEYRELASSLGAVAINGYTSFDLSAYWCLLPSSSLEKHLILESERFRRPVLRAFQSELEIVYEEFNTQQDSIRRRKGQALDRLLFKKHPYGQQPMIGTPEHLKNPSLREIHAFYDTYYVPNNMAIVLVGDLDFDETIRLVDRTFGQFEPEDVERPARPVENPIRAPRTTTILGPGEESVSFGFRLGGAGSRDEQLAMLTDMVLNNGFAGLFDIELNAKQAVRNAGCTVRVHNDYSVHYFDGYPKEGQSLEEVRDLMLAQIDRIKNGEFEEWLMRGAVNDLQKRLKQDLSTSINLSAACMHSFKRGESWGDHLAFTEELAEISKQELMEFVRQRYRDNYALVFKREGPASDVVKVEKPEITPIERNAETESGFARELARIETSIGEPLFVDYDRAISTGRTKTGVEVAFVENDKNDLFELDVVFDMGTNHDRKLALATRYCGLVGTERFSVDELKRRYYELGLTFSSYSTSDRTVFHLEGLQRDLGTGIELLDHFLGHLAVDETAYADLVDQLLQEREARLSDVDAILDQGLLSYALYGERSSLRNVLSEEELRDTGPAELTAMIQGLRGSEHRIFYYGGSLRQITDLLDAHYHANPVKKASPPAVFRKRASPPAVYFVDFDIVQAHLMVVTRGELFDKARIGPSNFYGPYIDHVVFQEIRNDRSLAYATSAAHIMAGRPGDFDYSYVYAGTQADKVPEALREMVGCMKNLAGTAEDVEFVRQDQLKRYRAERITGRDLFWNRERLAKMGIHHDVRKEMYATARGMTLEGLREFFEGNIGGRDTCILVVGNRDDIDIATLSTFGEVVELEPRYLFNF